MGKSVSNALRISLRISVGRPDGIRLPREFVGRAYGSSLRTSVGKPAVRSRPRWSSILIGKPIVSPPVISVGRFVGMMLSRPSRMLGGMAEAIRPPKKFVGKPVGRAPRI